jgi:hypothetical protein
VTRDVVTGPSPQASMHFSSKQFAITCVKSYVNMK